MRICLDVSQSVYEGTGSGRYVIELVKAFLRTFPDESYVLFGSASKKYESLVELGSEYKEISKDSITEKYYRFPPTFFEYVWNKFHLLPIERLIGQFDLYHSSDWTQAPSSAVKVTTVHDLIPFLFPEYVHPRIREAHELRWKHIVADKVEIVVDAAATKKDILDRFAVDASRIHVISLACSPKYYEIGKANIANRSDFVSARDIVLAKFDIQAKKYILAVGTLEPRKNIANLVEAYTRLDPSVRQEYSLVIVGKKSWADDLPKTAGVVLTGYVEEEDLPYLYAGAKCFVMPSLYEGFGLPVLEAMACGTPVLCSRLSSLPEIGGNDVHYIENPQDIDSIKSGLNTVLSTDQTVLSQKIQAAYTRAREFSWERTATETMGVYKQLMGK